MKTLREVLFERHTGIEPRLDAIREQVVDGLTTATAAKASLRPSALAADWRQFLWSLRWHLAGLSAAWLVALALDIDRTPTLAMPTTERLAPPPQQWLAALRENQKRLREFITAPVLEPRREAPKLAPAPRSETHFFPAPEV